MNTKNRILASCLVATATASWLLLTAARPQDAAPVPTQAQQITQLDWLAGAWSGPMWGGDYRAFYSTAAGGMVLSHSKLLVEEKERFFEFEVFEMRDGKIHLQPFPGGKKAVGFELASIDTAAKKAVFENPKKDFPTRITYHRKAADNLVITLDDPHGTSNKTEVFDLKR